MSWVKIQLESQTNDKKIKMFVKPTDPILIESIQEFFPNAINIAYKEADGILTCLFKEENKIFPDIEWSKDVKYIVTEKEDSKKDQDDQTFETMERLKNIQKKIEKIDEKVHKIEQAKEVDKKMGSMTATGTQLYREQIKCGLLKISDPQETFQLFGNQAKSLEKKNEKILEKFKHEYDLLVKNGGQTLIVKDGQTCRSKTDKLTENKHQHPMFFEILEMLKQDNFDVYNDKAYFLNQQRPDFVFNRKNKPFIPYYCGFIAELQLGDIDKEHKSRVIQYNHLVLEENPCRSFILSFVTNLIDIVFIKSMRGIGRINHQEFSPISFWDKGVEWLNHMLQDPKSVGYDQTVDEITFPIVDGGDNYYLYRFLGQGQTAKVFKFRKYDKKNSTLDFTDKDYVVKVFNNEKYYLEEKKLFDEIKERIGNQVQHFITKIAENPKLKSIVYSPYGKPIERLTKNRFDQMLACVEQLYKNGIIHRDLTPNHFLMTIRDEHEFIFVIDFGTALLTPYPYESENSFDKFVPYQGTIQYAAQEILVMLKNGGQRYRSEETVYRPKRRHDLESFVRTIMFMYYNLRLPVSCMHIENPDNTSYQDRVSRLAECSLRFWRTVDAYYQNESGSFWNDALEIARSPKLTILEDLKNHFAKLEYFYVDVKAILDEYRKTTIDIEKMEVSN